MIKIGKSKCWFGGARFKIYFLLGGHHCPHRPPPLSYRPATISELFLESEDAWSFEKDKGAARRQILNNPYSLLEP